MNIKIVTLPRWRFLQKVEVYFQFMKPRRMKRLDNDLPPADVKVIFKLSKTISVIIKMLPIK